MSILDHQRMDEAFAEAQTMLAAECPDADLAVIPGMGDAFDAGVWFGIVGALIVLERYGHLRLVDDGESRE